MLSYYLKLHNPVESISNILIHIITSLHYLNFSLRSNSRNLRGCLENLNNIKVSFKELKCSFNNNNDI